MKIKEFGDKKNPVFLLLPGTCCTWQINFKYLIGPLAQKYRVLCVNYTGFDGGDGIFTTMLSETGKIEKAINYRYNGHIKAVYGSSLGGSFASLLTQRRKIRIDHTFIGSSDLDQAGPFVARVETDIVGHIMFAAAQDEKKLKKLEELLYKKMGMELSGAEGLLNDYMDIIRRADRRSVKNQFYSDLVTPVGEEIDVPGNQIHVFYSEKMGEKYLKRYRKHYKHPDIIPFPMSHEGWLDKPELMIETFERCMQD